MMLDVLLSQTQQQQQRVEPRHMKEANRAVNVLVEAMDLLLKLGYDLPPFDQHKREDAYYRECDDIETDELSPLAEAPGSFIDNIRDNFLTYEERELPDGCLLRHYCNGNVRRINPRSDLIEEVNNCGNFLISLPDGRYVYQEMPGAPVFLCEAGEFGIQQLARTARFQIGSEEDIPAFYFEQGARTLLIDYENLRQFRLNSQVDRLMPKRPRTLTGLALLDATILRLFAPANAA